MADYCWTLIRDCIEQTQCACPHGAHVGFLLGKWAVGCGWANMCENKWGPTGNISK